MINFFRKTRKKLADDNKPLKYARYAIGENAYLKELVEEFSLEVRELNKNEFVMLGCPRHMKYWD